MRLRSERGALAIGGCVYPARDNGTCVLTWRAVSVTVPGE